MAKETVGFDRLPEKAQARLFALRHARDEAIGLAAWGSNQRRRAYHDLERLEAEETRQRNWAEGRGRRSESAESRVAELAAKRERVEANLKTAQERLSEYEAAAEHLGGLCARADSWIARLPKDAKITAATGKALDTLEDAQQASDEIRAEIFALQSAPIPSSEAKAIARQSVEELAEAGRPSVSRTIEAGLRPSWGKVAPVYGMVPEGADGAASLPLSVLAWLFPDDMVRAFEAEIDARADDKTAVPTEQRAGQLAKLRERLLKAEINEVATHEAELGPEDWSFRRQLDIRAVLMLRDGGDHERA